MSRDMPSGKRKMLVTTYPYNRSLPCSFDSHCVQQHTIIKIDVVFLFRATQLHMLSLWLRLQGQSPGAQAGCQAITPPFGAFHYPFRALSPVNLQKYMLFYNSGQQSCRCCPRRFAITCKSYAGVYAPNQAFEFFKCEPVVFKQC
jgi:hypothetical protein